MLFFFFYCSFASVAEPNAFPCSPGPISASSAKSKTSHGQPLKLQIIMKTVSLHFLLSLPFLVQACVFTVLQKGALVSLFFQILFQLAYMSSGDPLLNSFPLSTFWFFCPVSQMRLPSKPYSSLPIYSIGSTNTLPRDRLSTMAAVGQGLSSAGGSGLSGIVGPAEPSALKGAKTGAPKATGKASGSAGAAKSEKSSTSQQRRGLQKTMSK